MMTCTLCLFPETESLNHLPLPLGKGHEYSKIYLELSSAFSFSFVPCCIRDQPRFVCSEKAGPLGSSCPCLSASPAPLLLVHIAFPSVLTCKVRCHLRNLVLAAPFFWNGRPPFIHLPLLAWFDAARLDSRGSLMF